ncbi:MAG: DUF4249 family protein [Saprospiraceae bacterium]|nr:DUF4249 family protein [Saprospiraceae bacterium]
MQIRFLFILLAFMAGFSSCSNEFELIEEKIETPIVYSLLDYEAPYQYVRLERAFASPNQSAVELAKNPDSLYYKNAIVNLILKRGGVDQTFTLEEVDGNDVGYPRQDGVFAKEPNKLYRINSALLNLVPGDKVKLEVNIGEGNPVTAETTIITKPTSSFPRSGSPVAFSPTQGDNFKWNHVGNFPGSIFNLRAVIHYTEVSAGEATQRALFGTLPKMFQKKTSWPALVNFILIWDQVWLNLHPLPVSLMAWTTSSIVVMKTFRNFLPSVKPIPGLLEVENCQFIPTSVAVWVFLVLKLS